MKTFAVSYGWAGGKWHAKKFVSGLEKSGLKLTKDVATADVILAHSTGCYIIPKANKAKLILLIGLLWWPDQSLYRRFWRKQIHDTRHHVKQHGWTYTLQKYFWNVVYVIFSPIYFLVAIKNHHLLDFLDDLKGSKVVIVRNEEDFFRRLNSRKK